RVARVDHHGCGLRPLDLIERVKQGQFALVGVLLLVLYEPFELGDTVLLLLLAHVCVLGVSIVHSLGHGLSGVSALGGGHSTAHRHVAKARRTSPRSTSSPRERRT